MFTDRQEPHVEERQLKIKYAVALQFHVESSHGSRVARLSLGGRTESSCESQWHHVHVSLRQTRAQIRMSLSYYNQHDYNQLLKAFICSISLLFCISKTKKVNTDIAVRNRNYHTATENHITYGITVLPATRQRWLFRLYPSRSWYSI